MVMVKLVSFTGTGIMLNVDANCRSVKVPPTHRPYPVLSHRPLTNDPLSAPTQRPSTPDLDKMSHILVNSSRRRCRRRGSTSAGLCLYARIIVIFVLSSVISYEMLTYYIWLIKSSIYNNS